MPTLPHHKDTLRLLPGAAGVSGATVSFKRESDGVEITTATTDSDGRYETSLAATATTGASSFELLPGLYRTEVTEGNYTRKHSSTSIGTAGPINLASMVQLNRALGSGLISAPANGLNTGEVTSAGAARTVVVATFAAVIEGLPVWNDAARTLTIGANATGSTRIDTIVVEMVPAGNATEGKCTLKVVEGTTSQPTLTQSTTLWQLPLANVSVSNGASVITQGNITDRRDYVERSVTAVEADVVALEARVDDLEAVVPREDIVATYSVTLDPASVQAATWATTLVVQNTALTYHNGCSAIDHLTMSATAVHGGAANVGLITLARVSEMSGVPGVTHGVVVTMVNPTGGALNAASATIVVVVKRLVTS